MRELIGPHCNALAVRSKSDAFGGNTMQRVWTLHYFIARGPCQGENVIYIETRAEAELYACPQDGDYIVEVVY